MIRKGKQKVKIFKEDYRPVRANKNGEWLNSYSVGSVKNSGDKVRNTYNYIADSLMIYSSGKRKESRNICPLPFPFKKSYDSQNSFQVTPSENGRFSFSGNKCTGDYIISALLPAGSYTVSHTCNDNKAVSFKISAPINGIYDAIAPATISLSEEEAVSISLWIAPNLENSIIDIDGIGLQIEAGNVATEFSPSAGNPFETVSIKNPRPLTPSKGAVITKGKNILDSQKSLDEKNRFWPDAPIMVKDGVTWVTDEKKKITASGKLSMGEATYTICDCLDGHLENGKKHTLCANSTAPSHSSLVLAVKEKSDSSTIFYCTDGDVFNVDTNNFTYGPLCIKLLPGFTGEISFYPQVEEGITITGFQPYLKSETSIPSLLAIEVSAEDYYNYYNTTNKIHLVSDYIDSRYIAHHIAQKFLDGSEEITLADIQPEGYTVFKYSNPELSGGKAPLNCSHFKYVSDYTAYNDECISAGADTSEIYFKIKDENLPEKTVSAFKNLLSLQAFVKNPVTVYYRLSTPVYEGIEPPKIKTFPLITKVFSKPEEGYSEYKFSGGLKVVKAI